MEENIKIIENILADLKRCREQTDDFELITVANILDCAITDIEICKEDILYRKNKYK